MINRQPHHQHPVELFHAGRMRIWPRLSAVNDNRPDAAYIWRRIWLRLKQAAVAAPVIVLFGAALMSLLR